MQDEANTIVGYMNACANQLIEVELVTGTVIRGYASPYSDQCDHVRINPEDGSMHHVIVYDHIVRIRQLFRERRLDPTQQSK